MNKVEELVAYLKKCDEAYYGSGEVIASNDTYDSMVESLKRLDPTNPYLDKVGYQPNGTNKVGRLNPMGTLDKFHTDEEIKEWLASEPNEMVLLCPKYDGFGVELTYVDGKLVLASTRGDGNTGEDVTEAMKYVATVPQVLPECFKPLYCVRGECIIPRRNHDAIKALGYTAMRNAIPGIVRSCRKEALNYAEFVAYEFFDGNDSRITQRQIYSSLFNVEETEGFLTNQFKDILEARNGYGSVKDTYVYEIDGTVLKTNKIKEDDYRHPVHQIAWKFKSNRRETILRGIKFDVGASGNISVVGEFDPVEFQGAQLRTASIGSLQRYNSMKPTIGCTVEVSRRGDIIPYIEDVYDIDDSFMPMETCPCCGSSLVNYTCKNPECSDKVEKKVLQYVKGFGIKGIGVSLVSKLINLGYIKGLADIYKLDPAVILTIPRQGESVMNKWKELQVKEVTLLKFLSIYPFENLGESAWKSVLLATSIDKVMEMSCDDLLKLNIKGLGVSKAESLASQVHDNYTEIKELLNLVHII